MAYNVLLTEINMITKEEIFEKVLALRDEFNECSLHLHMRVLANGERIEDTPENEEKYKNEIRGGSVACSICGRAAIDDAPWL
jgi:hypothetical protein